MWPPYAAQTEQVITNCLEVLKAAGAAPADVVRSVIYVVSSVVEVDYVVVDVVTDEPPGAAAGVVAEAAQR